MKILEETYPLICALPAMQPVLINALSVRFNLAFCHTLREAVSSLDGGVNAIVCGIYFADGQVFDLLRLTKADPKTKHIPFFTAYGSLGALMIGVEQGIEIATRALGGEGFYLGPILRTSLVKSSAMRFS